MARDKRVERLAEMLSDDEAFQSYVTIAEANNVDIAVVLDEQDEFMSAARVARAIVMVNRQQEQQAS